MPKYVASRTLTGPLEWNATLIEGELEQAIPAIKEKHDGRLLVTGCGEFAHTLTRLGFVDEFCFWVHPHLWPTGPRIYDGVGRSGCAWSPRRRTAPAWCG